MKTRTTVLLPDELMRRLRDRAQRRRSTLTAEIEAAVVRYLGDDTPNAGLLELAGAFASERDWPAVDSDETRREIANAIERDAFGREPER
jgi:hypothetical protein